MPTATMCRFPKMRDEHEFEELVAEILRRMLRARLHRHGRRGQAQCGVDIVGPLESDPSKLVGVQCKNVVALSLADVEVEVSSADGFRPALTVYLIVTSLDRDAHLHRDVLQLNQQRIADGNFGVDIMFWQDLEGQLGGQQDLIAKHYPQFGTQGVSHTEEIQRRALSLVRAATITGRAARTSSALITCQCPLNDELDIEAAYSLMGDPRVIDANVDETRGVVGITVNRSSFPTALLLGDDESSWRFGA